MQSTIPEFRLDLFADETEPGSIGITTTVPGDLRMPCRSAISISGLQALQAECNRALSNSHAKIDVVGIGTELFDLVFRKSDSLEYLWHRFCADWLQAEGEARFILTCYEPWANLPWECLFDGANLGFVALRVHFLRGSKWLATTRSDASHPRPTALIAACNPYGDLALDEEIERCRSSWWSLYDDMTVLKDASRVEVLRRLKSGPVDLFHFAGHSLLDVDTDESRRSGIVALTPSGYVERADVVTAEELAQQLCGTRLAVLNSCWSGQHLGGSLLDTFARFNVLNVVAMNQAAMDREAVEFAGAFYGNLAARRSLEQALTFARRTVCELSNKSSITWGLPTAVFREPTLKLRARLRGDLDLH